MKITELLKETESKLPNQKIARALRDALMNYINDAFDEEESGEARSAFDDPLDWSIVELIKKYSSMTRDDVTAAILLFIKDARDMMGYNEFAKDAIDALISNLKNTDKIPSKEEMQIIHRSMFDPEARRTVLKKQLKDAANTLKAAHKKHQKALSDLEAHDRLHNRKDD